jgi:hypothetical protein
MNPATVQMIIALLPLAEKLIFTIGGKIIELNTTDLTSSEEVIKAFEAAKAEGFPVLTFK